MRQMRQIVANFIRVLSSSFKQQERTRRLLTLLLNFAPVSVGIVKPIFPDPQADQ
jgi:hypothetical protein